MRVSILIRLSIIHVLWLQCHQHTFAMRLGADDDALKRLLFGSGGSKKPRGIKYSDDASDDDELLQLFSGSYDGDSSSDTDFLSDEESNNNSKGKLTDSLNLNDLSKKVKKLAKTANLEDLFGSHGEDDGDHDDFSDIKPIPATSGYSSIRRLDDDSDIDELVKDELGGIMNTKHPKTLAKNTRALYGPISIRNAKDAHRSSDAGEYRKSTTLNDEDLPEDTSDNPGLSASLRYLGSGYDIVFGNPLGDPIVMMDQGYRNPVIKLNWDIEYSNKDGANLKEPYGSWVRPEYSCRQAESIDHINSVDDFKKELSVDAHASTSIPFFFSFTGSTGYKNFVRSTATNKVPGIVNYRLMETTNEFKDAVKALPETFDTSDCTLDVFKANDNDQICSKSVIPWMQFLKMFGTHFTTVVHLGGKITNQVQIKKSDVLKMQKSGVNVDMAIKATLSLPMLDSVGGDLNVDSNVEHKDATIDFKYDKKVVVIGGEGLVDSKDLNSVSAWAKELYKKPMPIKTKLESIKSLLHDRSRREAFDLALKFYSETYGVTPDEIYKKYGKEYGIASLVQKGHQVVYTGTRSGTAVCPNKTVVMMGYSMIVSKSKNNYFAKDEYVIHIAPCPIGDEKCIVTNDTHNTESRIWIVCGDDPIPLLVQETSTSIGTPAKASCPSGFSIAYGFAFSLPRGNVALKTDAYPCRAGTNSCSHTSYDNKAATAIWIACVENGAPQLNDITNHMVSTSNPVCSSKSKDNAFVNNLCPPNSSLIAGWEMYLSESNNAADKHYGKCSRGLNGCLIDKHLQTDNDCRAYYSWISCLHVNHNQNEAK